MADILSKGTMFPTSVATEMFNKVKGHSTLAKLSAQAPIQFNGQTEFTFTLDKEIDVVAENGAKAKGGATVAPVTIVPIKVEYGARISDEFKYASEEVQLQYLQSFADAFARKVAKGLDLMAFHGINPRTKEKSAVIGANNFTTAVTNETTADAGAEDDALDTAIAMVNANDSEVSGLALSRSFASEMAKIKANGVSQYPEFRFGGNPDAFAGIASDVNSTIETPESLTGGGITMAFVGDFANAFKWGVAKEIPLEIIEYGNPDNDAALGDLKGHNQVYLRSEVYLGWGILDPNAFAKVQA